LTSLSTSFSGPAKPSASTTTPQEPSGKRKRLHLLYLINDLLYHAKFHATDASVVSKVQPILVGLLSSAACFRNSPKHYRKIEELLDIWETKNYYSTDYIERLREAAEIARDADAEQSTRATQSPDRNGGTHIESRPRKRIPFVMPAIHGDQGVSWYDLPAGNLMPHITLDSTRPINPNLVKPLKFVAGPADEDLANAVKNLLREVNDIFGDRQLQDQRENVSWDIDELGQAIIRDNVTGEALSSEGYYGWSTGFCEKMKRRRKGLEQARMGDGNEQRGRSRSRSLSSSLSSHRYKRRRFSNSDEERSRSSNSRSRQGQHAYYNHSRSRSRERSLPLQGDKRSGSSHESISRSASRERGGRDVPGDAYVPQPHSLDALPDVVQEPFRQDVHSMAVLQQAFLPQSGHHYNSGMITIPPPPPPHYGKWPPQMPLTSSTVPHIQESLPAGAWPPPPPPPPPFLPNWSPAPYVHMPQGGNGRGSYGGRGRGGEGHSHQVAGSGYNGYRGNNGQGNGRS